MQELRRRRREDLARLADVDDEEEQRDEQRGEDRLRRPPRLAQRALPEHPGLRHAATSCTSPAPRLRVRPVASRNTSSSVGSVVRPEALAQLGLELRRRALAHDHAVVDDRQPVAELVGLLEVLRGEEDRRAAAVDAPHLVPHGQPARGVEPGGRLVEEQHLGLVHERGREVEPPLHAAAVALDAPVGGVVELDQLEQLLRARRRLARRIPNSRACSTSSSRPVWRGSSPASCSATPILCRAASGRRARTAAAARAWRRSRSRRSPCRRPVRAGQEAGLDPLHTDDEPARQPVPPRRLVAVDAPAAVRAGDDEADEVGAVGSSRAGARRSSAAPAASLRRVLQIVCTGRRTSSVATTRTSTVAARSRPKRISARSRKPSPLGLTVASQGVSPAKGVPPFETRSPSSRGGPVWAGAGPPRRPRPPCKPRYRQAFTLSLQPADPQLTLGADTFDR